MKWKPLPHILEELKGAPFSPDGYEQFVFQWDRAFFEERVRMVGFERGTRVLDAGCGFGHFGAALARFNDSVLAIDRADYMLKTAAIVKQRWNVPNMEIKFGELPNTGASDCVFDFIWCSGVLMLLDRDKCMKEFHRILKPGGRLYVMLNGRGRWVFNLASRLSSGNNSLLKMYVETILKTSMDGSQCNYLTVNDVPEYCSMFGFRCIGCDIEGNLDLLGKGRRLPMHDSFVTVSVAENEPIHLEHCIEFVAEKVS